MTQVSRFRPKLALSGPFPQRRKGKGRKVTSCVEDVNVKGSTLGTVMDRRLNGCMLSARLKVAIKLKA